MTVVMYHKRERPYTEGVAQKRKETRMNDFDISDRAERPEGICLARWFDADASELERAYNGLTARDVITVEDLEVIFDAPLPF